MKPYKINKLLCKICFKIGVIIIFPNQIDKYSSNIIASRTITDNTYSENELVELLKGSDISI